jgi:cytochrome c556
MRRFLTFVLACAMASGVALVAEKAKTPDDLSAAMKKIGTSQQALGKAINAMAYPDAKKNLATIRSEVKDAGAFWELKKKADAVKFTEDVVTKIDALDKLLEAKTPDQAAITAASREVATTCAGCHRVYRATDDNNKFIIKPGTVS